MSCSVRIPRELKEPASPFAIMPLEWLPPGHPERTALEAFVAATFQRNYGARPTQFCEQLMGWRGSDGNWQGAVGYTPLADRRAFLEQYLELPLERAIGACLGHVPLRNSLVEAGNLAALDAGGARILIAGLTHHLQTEGYAWVGLTGTRVLLNSFARLRIPMQVLGLADPERLPDHGRSWGAYYQTQPKVAFTDIARAAQILAR